MISYLRKARPNKMLNWFPRRHWLFWIIFLLGILFLLWLFFGGKQQEFVGLSPLLPGQEDIVTDGLLVEEVCSNEFHTRQDVPHEDTVVKINNIAFNFNDDHVPEVPPPKKPSRWKRQEACCRAVEEIFGKPFRRDVRDLPWLYNPETGANLELDCYNEELGIAVEHNGEHHYKFPNRWNKTREEWIAMVRRDKLKPEQCDRNGVYLVTVPYWVPYDKIKAEIRRQLEPLIKPL